MRAAGGPTFGTICCCSRLQWISHCGFAANWVFNMAGSEHQLKRRSWQWFSLVLNACARAEGCDTLG